MIKEKIEKNEIIKARYKGVNSYSTHLGKSVHLGILQVALYLFLLIQSTSYLSAVEIDVDANSSNLSILENSFLFIDKTNSLSLEDIKNKKFKLNQKPIINLGYEANMALWIKFTLHNKSQRNIKKILEFKNHRTESVILYSKGNIRKGGFHHLSENHRSVNPSFVLYFKKDERITYYLQTRAKSKPLTAQIVLWENEAFIKANFKNELIRITFLAMMFILLLYNMLLLFFTKDKAYLYYILYLSSAIIMNAYASGFLPFYLFSEELASWSMKIHLPIVSITLFFIFLFTQEILKTKQFKKLDKILNTVLYLCPIIAILNYMHYISSTYIIIFDVFTAFLLIFTGFYTQHKGIKVAQYYLLGWGPLLILLLIYALNVAGFLNLEFSLLYVAEIVFVLEALLFSIALAHRIQITNEEKALSDAKFIALQEKEKELLTILVEEKTNELKHSLSEKEILYKELNHRIKNNFMMILSLLKLQISRSKLTETKESLKTTQNRIKSIATLYEILLLSSDEVNIDSTNYLQKIYKNIAINFEQEVEITYDIKYDIELNTLIYVGLVFNELVSNSFKYAFPNAKGKIWVTLKKEDEKIFLIIKDNGQGFKERRKNSLGLTIVETLIEGQLGGELNISSDKGTELIMCWEE